MEKIEQFKKKIETQVEKETIIGYDPYDILNSKFIYNKVTNSKIRLLLIQLNKFSPINFRKLLGIKKIYSSKAMAFDIINSIKQKAAIIY